MNMKETKNFFTKNNRLNKGYSKPLNSREQDNNFYRKKFEHILPPIDVMSEYENIHPGTLEKLISMAQKEQTHRHALELKNLEVQEKATKVSKVCALVFGIFLLSSIIFLILLEKFIIAGIMILFIIGFGMFFLRKTTKKNEYIRSKNYTNS